MQAYTYSPGPTAIVNAMYAQGLNRSPNDSGFRQFRDSLVGGASVRQLFQTIVDSNEYRLNFVDGKSEFFVLTELYKAVLSRCPDQKGLHHHVDLLKSKGGTGEYMQVARGLFHSHEYQLKFGVNTVPNPKPGYC